MDGRRPLELVGSWDGPCAARWGFGGARLGHGWIGGLSFGCGGFDVVDGGWGSGVGFGGVGNFGDFETSFGI